jgi:hypothetical protein
MSAAVGVAASLLSRSSVITRPDSLCRCQLEEIRKEVEIISQSHERDVDRKDAIIQMLDRDVDEAEEQYQVALRQHLRNIDSFIDIQVRCSA